MDDVICFCLDGVYILQGSEIKKISNQTIDRMVSQNGAAVSMFRNEFGRYIAVRMAAATSPSYFFIYDMNNGIWSELEFVDSSQIRVSKHLGQVICASVTGAGQTGALFEWDGASPSYQDNGSAYTMTVQLEQLSLNKGLGFTINGIRLIADKQSSGTTTLEASGDDYQSFRTIGAFDMTKNKKELRRGGYYDSSVAFRLTHSDNTPWRGQAIEVDWEPSVV